MLIAVAGAAAGPSATNVARELRREVLSDATGKALRVAFVPPTDGDYAGTLRNACVLLGAPPVELTPVELVTPGRLTPERYPVVVYTGRETYVHTVKTRGDGLRALQDYLRAGGCLVVAGYGWPFYYALESEGGALKRMKGVPHTDGARSMQVPISSAPCPPMTELPRFELLPNQPLFRHTPARLRFNRGVSGGYRLMCDAGLPEADRFIPAMVLRDRTGKSHGAVAAVLEHGCEQFGPGRTVFLWSNVLALDEGLTIAMETMRYAIRAARLPEAPRREPCVAILPHDTAGRDQLIANACSRAGAACHTLSPAEFADPAVFNPRNFPVAIHAVDDEYYVDAVPGRANLWRTYVDHVKGGGFLVACGTMWQFYYAAKLAADGEWKQQADPHRKVESALRLSVTPSLFQDGRDLILECLPGQDIVTFPTPIKVTWTTWGYYRGVDRHAVLGPDVVPIARVVDAGGNTFGGYALALMRYTRGEWRGNELLWLWGNLLEAPSTHGLLDQAVYYAVQRRKDALGVD